MNELVSVVIPAYNAERFLRDALRSAMEQTWPDLDVVVVNDGSTDGTLALARSFAADDDRVTVIDQPNGGLSAARNAGIDAARGDFICFLDADDAYLADKVERQLAFLRQRPDCELVYSDFYIGDADLRIVSLRETRPIDAPMRTELIYRNAFAPVAPLLRRTLVDRTGRFDTDLKASEDLDYWIRAASVGPFGYLPGAVAIYRTHGAQMHHDRPRMRSNRRKVMAKHFPRGTREWRTAEAVFAYSDARTAKAQRRYGSMISSLARCFVYAGGPTGFRNVRRWIR